VKILTGFFGAVGESFFGWMFSAMAYLYGNISIMLALTFGAIILLRPITNRLIAPRWRVWIWFTGWYCGFLVQIYSWISKIKLLPVSFRSLIIPRNIDYGGIYDSFPEFLPEATKAGDYSIAFPGGAEVPVHLSSAMIGFIGLLWFAIFVATLIWEQKQINRLKAIGRAGVIMDEEQRAKYGIDRENVVVRLCKDLPTSFVRFGNDDHFGDGTRFVICVQDDLPEDKLRLVLMHEMEHLNQFHAWWKSTITMVLFLYWWNPILWIAHRLTCRDMELACDEAVMEKLSEHDRREYARTLVELGAGKPMWGAMSCFGECDAALRVKNVVNWKPRTETKDALSVVLMVVLILFFYGGSQMDATAREHMDGLNWTWYANGAPLEQDMKAIWGEDLEITEVWEDNNRHSVGEHTLVVKDASGAWFVVACEMVGDGDYRITSSSRRSHGPGPDLTNYRGIRIPDDVFKALYG